MNKLFTLLSLLITLNTSAQVLGVYSGFSTGTFYDRILSEGHASQKYRPQNGYLIGFEIKNIPLDKRFMFGAKINYQTYGGYFYTRSGGLGGSISDEGNITKQVLSFELNPFDVRCIQQRLRISPGLVYSALINYHLTGTHTWGYGNGTTYYFGTRDLNSMSGFVKPYYWGLNANIGYTFKLRELIIEPKYCFYKSLSDEFDQLQAPTKSWRQTVMLCIGIPISKK
jgi:hypothetical protein